jgi:hypothetical protein
MPVIASGASCDELHDHPPIKSIKVQQYDSDGGSRTLVLYKFVSTMSLVGSVMQTSFLSNR